MKKMPKSFFEKNPKKVLVIKYFFENRFMTLNVINEKTRFFETKLFLKFRFWTFINVHFHFFQKSFRKELFFYFFDRAR